MAMKKMTDAEKAKLKKSIGKTNLDKVALDKAKAKKASTSYSPKPMSAKEKKAAGFRGATAQWQSMLRKTGKA